MKFNVTIKNDSCGFTIIELLLAMGVLASISLFGIRMLSNQFDTRNQLQVIQQTQHALDAAMSKIFDDLRHAYIITKADQISANLDVRAVKPQFVWRPSGGDPLYMFTSQNYHSFVANTPQSNICMVGYFVKKDKDGTKNQLFRRVDTDLKETIDKPEIGTEDILISDLKEFKVTFWDGQDMGREDWDSNGSDTSGKLPKMARIQLSMFFPISEAEKQRQEVDVTLNRERRDMSLESTVYFMSADGQADLKEPLKEYKWR